MGGHWENWSPRANLFATLVGQGHNSSHFFSSNLFATLVGQDHNFTIFHIFFFKFVCHTSGPGSQFHKFSHFSSSHLFATLVGQGH